MVKGLGSKERVFIVIAICPDSYKRSNNGKKNSKQFPHKLPNDPQTPIKTGKRTKPRITQPTLSNEFKDLIMRHFNLVL